MPLLLPVPDIRNRGRHAGTVCEPAWRIRESRRHSKTGTFTGSGPLLVAVFVDRSYDDKEIIRIISAREEEQYEQRTYTRQFEEGN
jgi:uncharacterized DUF497 family protein